MFSGRLSTFNRGCFGSPYLILLGFGSNLKKDDFPVLDYLRQVFVPAEPLTAIWRTLCRTKKKTPAQRRKAPEKEEGDLKDGRFYCRRVAWWDKHSDEELEVMQRRGQQLREGGYGAVEWDDLTGPK